MMSDVSESAPTRKFVTSLGAVQEGRVNILCMHESLWIVELLLSIKFSYVHRSR